ncbi:MAG: M20 family metallopeptidase [bacterium]|nr:M20 family metallopeptidase [bacterium]
METVPPRSGSANVLAGKAAAAVNADEVVRLTRELVRIPSVYRPDDPAGNETAVAAYLAGHLSRLGLRVSVHEAAPGRPNVVADWTSGRRGRGLILEGHTDVVTEGDRSAWSHPPFDAEVSGGRIYGRGAADMKGGLAAAACALDAVRRAAPDLPGRVRIAAVADEEGMMLGIKSFIRDGHAQGFDGAIVCEPEENEICLRQKGAMRVLVSFTGKMAHGAMPYAGVNPIPAAARFVTLLAEEDRRQQEGHERDPHLGLPHITPTTIRAPAHGEPQFNVMAGEARVTVDVRTIPGQNHADLHRAICELANAAQADDPCVRVTVELVEDRPWTETPPWDPLVRAIERAFLESMGREPRYGGVPGSTDGTFLHAWARIPVVTIGPGNRQIPHQADEYVEVGELVEAARLYAAAIVYFLGEEAAPNGARRCWRGDAAEEEGHDS